MKYIIIIVLLILTFQITNASDLENVVTRMLKKGDKNLLLSIIDNNNRRRYLGVKIK